jgi:hypothetical protein
MVYILQPAELASTKRHIESSEKSQPGIHKPRLRLLNCEATKKKYEMKWLLEEYPLINQGLWTSINHY